MVSINRWSFRSVANSVDIQRYMELQDFVPLTTHQGVRDAVYRLYDLVRSDTAKAIRTSIMAESKLFMSEDEWTSTSMLRFLNVFLYSSKPFPWGARAVNLGLAYIRDKADAENICRTTELQLREFEVEISEVNGMVTDGAAVMRKAASIFKSNNPMFVHLKCVLHAIQLGVLDFLRNEYIQFDLLEAEMKVVNLETSDDPQLEPIDDDEAEICGTFEVLLDEETIPKLAVRKNLNAVLQKVRAIVRFINVSTNRVEK